MGSIPKIVSTPLKWASKKILNQTLLRFPGGDPHTPVACVYCPEMCRFSCPTAVVSSNDAVTPCNKMGLLHKEEKWPDETAPGSPLWPLYDCTGCGRCTEYCVYEMPVADHLFAARSYYSWDVAKIAAAEIQDEMDPVGDLADELGDIETADRRMGSFIKSQAGRPFLVYEPKSLHFLRQRGHSEGELIAPPAQLNPQSLAKLAGKVWLLHESVWYSRRLDQSEAVVSWLQKVRAQGVQIRRPFAQGRDCMDAGGEGAYSKLFPKQAIQMAREFWERDQHRADGILCWSSRSAEHFRKSLSDSKVLVYSLSDLGG